MQSRAVQALVCKRTDIHCGHPLGAGLKVIFLYISFTFLCFPNSLGGHVLQ